MNIHVTATTCTVNGHEANWHKDRRTIAAMMKSKLFG